jgi:hypothetical protein
VKSLRLALTLVLTFAASVFSKVIPAKDHIVVLLSVDDYPAWDQILK